MRSGAQRGPRKDPNPLFFSLLQNHFGYRGAFDVCFGSASLTLEYVLGRPLVTCLQAESQSPGSWPSLMKYFRELLTLLIPMCTPLPSPRFPGFFTLSLPPTSTFFGFSLRLYLCVVRARWAPPDKLTGELVVPYGAPLPVFSSRTPTFSFYCSNLCRCSHTLTLLCLNCKSAN